MWFDRVVTDVAETHDTLRPLMFSIAYRMLGSVVEAEDVVQEAFIRMQAAHEQGTTADSAEAYATTVTTRLAIDTLRSARVRREHYTGTWLPEPLLSLDEDPLHRLEVQESVSYALLIVLERLSPEERAVFLLREVFGYDYAAIAEVVDKSEGACRQLLSRAKAHVADAHAPQPRASAVQGAEITKAFFAAVEEGDLARLESLLAEDARAVGDGGGKAPAAAHTIESGRQVARFLAGLGRQQARLGLVFDLTEANSQPAVRFGTEDGLVLGVFVLEVVDGRIVSIHNQINPDKLGHLGAVGDLAGLMRSAGGSGR